MEKLWKAKWIVDESFYGLMPIDIFHRQQETKVLPPHEEHLKNRHMLVRKIFKSPAGIRNSFIDITADDYYKLYINGSFVGQGPAPGYHFHYNYNRYDISCFLQPGENVIAVHVYYQGLINRVWNSGDYRQGMLAEVYIDDEIYLCTDSSWKYTRAMEYTGTETTGYETQYLENIDSRLKEVGWRNMDYDDSKWKNALENPGDDHKLVLQTTPVLKVYEVSPKEVKDFGDGHYVIDFGHEVTGQFKMKAGGKAGQKIRIMCGEELEEGLEASVRSEMRCNCKYRESWILSGAGDILEFYDYKAFRYVEVMAPAEVAEVESFCAIVRHYPYDEDGCQFTSSDPLLNDIWKICKNGVKYGSQEAYLDCPSREKGQYLGDGTITSHSHVYLTGDLRLFKKMLTDFALSTNICPGMMAVAPGSCMQEIADFSLQWPLQLLNYYNQSGDLLYLKEMYPVAEGILKYFKSYEREDGLLENVKGKWNLVDWPENLRDGYDFDLSPVVGDGCHNVINAFYYGALKTTNEIRKILGIRDEHDLNKLKQSFIKVFYRQDKKLFADSEVSSHASLHSNAITLFYGLAPLDAHVSITQFIRKKKLSCGVYVAYFLLKGLAGIGQHDLVYELLTSQDTQSWANMIREGATTCFEAWGKEQKWNTSLCHPWASSPIPVFIEDIAGLRPGKPGWEEISLNPHIPKALKAFSLEFRTIKGKIKLEYRDESLNITAPWM